MKNNRIQKSNFTRKNFSATAFCLSLFAIVCLFSALSASAQRRDHLTEKEIEVVRDVQEIDRRMEVFIKAVDRRFLVLNNDSSQTKQIEKDLEKWGELPTGTRQELLSDIEKIIEEAISKIDDVAARDMNSDLFPIAVHTLADGAKKFIPQLKMQYDKAETEKEKGAIIGAIEECEEIIAASAKVKRETPKEIRKRREKESKVKSDN